MRRGKYAKRGRLSLNKKSLALVLALVLMVGGVMGGTLAWLIDKTDKVENKFTTSDVDVTLNETKTDFKMVPGWTIDKDPVVTLSGDSEDCYLFIKVEKSGGNVTVGTKTYSFGDFIAYAIDSGWTQLMNGNDKVDGVYYKKITEASQKGESVKHHILGAGSYTDSDNVKYEWSQDQVLTKPEVTKEMMDAAKANNNALQPKLTFTAYAVQLYKSNSTAAGAQNEFTPYEAWQKASN